MIGRKPFHPASRCPRKPYAGTFPAASPAVSCRVPSLARTALETLSSIDSTAGFQLGRFCLAIGRRAQLRSDHPATSLAAGMTKQVVRRLRKAWAARWTAPCS